MLQDQIRLSTKAAEKQSADLMNLAARVEKLAVAVATTTDTLADSVNTISNQQSGPQQIDSRNSQLQASYVLRQPRPTPQNQQRINYGREAGAQNQATNRQSNQQWQPTQRNLQQNASNVNGSACSNCGLNHEEHCWARDLDCRNCGKSGHYAKVCRSGRRN